MLEMLSSDTQATLLLVGDFTRSNGAKPLTTVEYNKLAKQLHELNLRPADLVREIPKQLVADRDRLKGLLSRGTSLALAMERWSQLGIKVVGRGDDAYPKSLRKKLRGAASPIIYYAGNPELMNAEAICVVGSRNVSDAGLKFATELGKRCATEGLCVVSGDARGTDRAAMEGSLDNKGCVVAVLVDSLAKAVLAKRNRAAILAGELLLMTPYSPEGGFTVYKAMDRNKYMYALSSAAVIVDSDIKGGTWSGAVENEKRRWTSAFVRMDAEVPLGNQRLAQMGLRPIPPLQEDEKLSLRDFLFSNRGENTAQRNLLSETSATEAHAKATGSPSLYDHFLRDLAAWLTDGPQKEAAIAERFDLERSQVKRWLDRALEDDALERLKRPVRYGLRSGEGDAVQANSSNAQSDLLL